MFWTYRLAALGALLTALLAGYGAWAKHMDSVGYARAVSQYTAAALVAEQASRAKEQAMLAQSQKAQDEGKQREIKLAADARNLRLERDGLRGDLATIRNQLPSLTRAAIERFASAASVVFDQCVREYSNLAQDADRISSERQTLISAWPK